MPSLGCSRWSYRREDCFCHELLLLSSGPQRPYLPRFCLGKLSRDCKEPDSNPVCALARPITEILLRLSGQDPNHFAFSWLSQLVAPGPVLRPGRGRVAPAPSPVRREPRSILRSRAQSSKKEIDELTSPPQCLRSDRPSLFRCVRYWRVAVLE